MSGTRPRPDTRVPVPRFWLPSPLRGHRGPCSRSVNQLLSIVTRCRSGPGRLQLSQQLPLFYRVYWGPWPGHGTHSCIGLAAVRQWHASWDTGSPHSLREPPPRPTLQAGHPSLHRPAPPPLWSSSPCRASALSQILAPYLGNYHRPICHVVAVHPHVRVHMHITAKDTKMQPWSASLAFPSFRLYTFINSRNPAHAHLARSHTLAQPELRTYRAPSPSLALAAATTATPGTQPQWPWRTTPSSCAAAR